MSLYSNTASVLRIKCVCWGEAGVLVVWHSLKGCEGIHLVATR